MKDKLTQAARILEEQQTSCVIYHTKDRIRTSEAIGIKPLMAELRQERTPFAGCVIADKVVGKAAALMAVFGQADAVYGKVMSESAVKVLEKQGLYYAYGQIVPYIENRAKTGMCPLEEAVQMIDDLAAAFAALEQTIAKLMAQK